MKSPKNVESERFIQVIDNLINSGKLKSYYKLAQELNIHIQRFSDIKSGKQSVGRKLIDDICNLYPTVSKAYITAGVNIANSQIPTICKEIGNTNYKEMENLKKRIEELERVLREREEKNLLLQEKITLLQDMVVQLKEMQSILKERNQLTAVKTEKANRD